MQDFRASSGAVFAWRRGTAPTTPATVRRDSRWLLYAGSLGGSKVWASFGATAGGSAPTAPTGLSASVTGSTTVTLTWTDASSDETGFVVQVDGGGGYVNASGATNPTAAGVQTFSATGLTAATVYAWRVGAVNGSGTSYTVGSSFTTDNPGGGGGTPPLEMSADNCAQAAASSQGAIAQSHNVVAAACAQAAVSSASAITQVHVLAGSNCSQSATSGTGVVGLNGAITLSAVDCAQSAASGTGGITIGDLATLIVSTWRVPAETRNYTLPAEARTWRAP